MPIKPEDLTDLNNARRQLNMITAKQEQDQNFDARREYADVLEALARAGYAAGIANTGGGCESIEVALPGNRRFLINDKDDLLARERADHNGWFAGLYDEDEEMVRSASTDDGSAAGLVVLLNSMRAGIVQNAHV